MSIHRPSFLIPLFLLAALSSYGCDDNGATGVALNNSVGPSPLASTPAFISRAVTVQPASIDAQRVTGAVCPSHPPFLAPISVVFDGVGRSDLSLSQVQMQFVDRTGVVGGLMRIPQHDLVHRFGSTALPALGTRAFPFSFPFGCVGQRAGTLTVIVFAGDSLGHERSTAVHVSIR